MKLVKEVAEQSTKEDSRRELQALLICSSTTIRNELFATLHVDRKQLLLQYRHGDPQKAIHGSMFRRPMTVHRKGKKQSNSNLNLGHKRQNSLGKSRCADE